MCLLEFIFQVLHLQNVGVGPGDMEGFLQLPGLYYILRHLLRGWQVSQTFQGPRSVPSSNARQCAGGRTIGLDSVLDLLGDYCQIGK